MDTTVRPPIGMIGIVLQFKCLLNGCEQRLVDAGGIRGAPMVLGNTPFSKPQSPEKLESTSPTHNMKREDRQTTQLP